MHHERNADPTASTSNRSDRPPGVFLFEITKQNTFSLDHDLLNKRIVVDCDRNESPGWRARRLSGNEEPWTSFLFGEQDAGTIERHYIVDTTEEAIEEIVHAGIVVMTYSSSQARSEPDRPLIRLFFIELQPA